MTLADGLAACLACEIMNQVPYCSGTSVFGCVDACSLNKRERADAVTGRESRIIGQTKQSL